VAKHQAPVSDVTKLLDQAADEERRLLKRERKAEKRVASLRSELAKAEERFDAVRIRYDELQAEVSARAQALAEAESELARHHTARASGPGPTAAQSESVSELAEPEFATDSTSA
jgi:chromosome segregation ATPase